MTDKSIKLAEYWPYQAVVLADLIAKHTTKVLKTNSDLNLSQWRVLAAVAEQEGRTAAEVVTVTPMDKGIVSRATASLVANGVLKKVLDKDDKRRARLYTTKRGALTYAKIAQDLTSRTDKLEITSSLNGELLRAIKDMSALNL